MNIVIEGCDATGKSTLAKFLSENLGMYYWHESQPRTFDEYCQMLSSGGIIFDRFCFGQFVYNEPSERKMTEEELRDLTYRVFKETHTILLYVDCDTNTIINRMLKRGEGSEKITLEMEKWVKNIRGSYRSLLKRNGIAYININGGNALWTSQS